jgi:hypothetical protein
MTTMLVGILLGWGIGAAAMRAAIATRDMAHVQSQIQQIQARQVIIDVLFQARCSSYWEHVKCKPAHKQAESTHN